MGASQCCRRCGAWLSAFGLLLAAPAAAEPVGAPSPWSPSPSSPSLARVELGAGAQSNDLLGSHRAAPAAPFERLASARGLTDGAVRISLLHQGPGALPRLEPFVALRLELRLAATGSQSQLAWRDLSSALGASYQISARTRLSLALFPFDTNYARLGHLHALDWGGTDAAERDSVFVGNSTQSPGAAVSLDAGSSRLMLATKTALTADPWLGQHRLWGVFGTASFALSPAWSADAGLGYFQRPAGGPGAGPSFLEGANARLMWHASVVAPELAIEPLRVPELVAEPASITQSVGGEGAAIALEGSFLVTRPAVPGLPPNQRLRAAPAAALYGSWRGTAASVHAAVVYRSLAFALKDDARVGPELLENRLAELAELSGWLGASVEVLSGLVTPSCELGLTLPAALRGPSIWPSVSQSFVLGAGRLTPLPLGAERLPSVAARAGLRVDPAPWLRLGLALTYQRDPNRVMLTDSPRGVMWAFGSPDVLSVLGAATASFEKL